MATEVTVAVAHDDHGHEAPSSSHPFQKGGSDSDTREVLVSVPMKGGKCGSKSRRFVLLVEDSNRTFWYQVFAAVALLFIAGAAIACILVFTVGQSDDGGSAVESNKRQGLGEVTLARYESCEALVARMQTASITHTLQWWNQDPALTTQRSQWLRTDQPWITEEALEVIESDKSHLQHDILVDGGRFLYAAAGQQLVVLEPGAFDAADANTSTVVARTPLLDRSHGAPLALSLQNAEDPLRRPYVVPYGLSATFRARELLLSASHDVLMVVGTGIGAAPIRESLANRAASSPRIAPGPNPPSDYRPGLDTYTSTSLRPFVTSVVLFFDVSTPAAPELLSVTEYEGAFVSAQVSSEFVYFIMRQATHVPRAESGGARNTSTGLWDSSDVMPVLRHRSAEQLRAGPDGSFPWETVAACTDARYVQTRGTPAYADETRLLIVAALQLHGRVGYPVKSSHVPVALAWSPNTEGYVSSPRNLFITEAISDDAGVSGPFAPSAGAEATVETPVISTALLNFELVNGTIVHQSTAMQEGELLFRGAMSYDSDHSLLKVLSTLKYEASKFHSSTLSLYRTNLTVVSNVTRLFPEQTPTSMFFAPEPYGSDPRMRRAFVALSFASPPQVYAIQYRASEPFENQVAYRLLVNEVPQLMSTVLSNQGDQLLLVGGRPILRQPTDALVPPADPAPASAASSTDIAKHGFQFSIYGSASGQQPEVLHNITVTTAEVYTEAFLDARSILLFSPPHDTSSSFLLFPMNVSMPCNGKPVRGIVPRNASSGAAVWRLKFTGKAGQSLKAEVSDVGFVEHNVGGADGSSPCQERRECPSAVVKRIRYVAGRVLLMSSSSLSVLDWAPPALDASAPLNTVVDAVEPMFKSVEPGIVPAQLDAATVDSCRRMGQCCMVV